MCHEFGISQTEIEGPSRKHRAVLPRHLAMALALTTTGKSMFQIAQRFGGRDHTTVVYARAKFAAVVARVGETLPDDAPPEQWAYALRMEIVGEKNAA